MALGVPQRCGWTWTVHVCSTFFEELRAFTPRETAQVGHTPGSDLRDKVRYLRGVSMVSHQSGSFTETSVHVITNSFYAPAEDARVNEKDHTRTLRK